MNRLNILLSLLALQALSLAADPLDSVFTHIDAASKTFRAMTADISQTDHTAIVNDDSVKIGSIKLLRGKGGDTRMLVAFTSQPPSNGFARPT